MARKPSFTKAEKRIVEGARRRVTAAEKLASGGRFSLGGEYFVSATVKKITPNTAFLTVSRVKDFLAGVSHATATALRKAGLLPYKGAAAEEQAAKQAATKATPASKMARSRKARRNARRQRASSKAGIERGAKQRQRTLTFLKEKFAQHERYLKTGQDKIDEDEYRRVIRLAHEYGIDENTIDRLHESYTSANKPWITISTAVSLGLTARDVVRCT
jgi:hypothetical protein